MSEPLDAEDHDKYLKKIVDTLTDVLLELRGLREDVRKIPNDLAAKLDSR